MTEGQVTLALDLYPASRGWEFQLAPRRPSEQVKPARVIVKWVLETAEEVEAKRQARAMELLVSGSDQVRIVGSHEYTPATARTVVGYFTVAPSDRPTGSLLTAPLPESSKLTLDEFEVEGGSEP